MGIYLFVWKQQLKNRKRRPRIFSSYRRNRCTVFLVVNLLQLVFETVDVAFPPTPESVGIIPSISFPIAALIVGFPLYILLAYITIRGRRWTR